MQLNTRPFEFLSKFLLSCPERLQSRKSICKETGCTSYGNQVAVATNFVRWGIVLVDPQDGSCFLPTP